MVKTVSLFKLKENKKARISEVSGGNVLKHRLMSMGIYPGRQIIKLSHMALRGPVTIKVGRSFIALGHNMASKVLVELE